MPRTYIKAEYFQYIERKGSISAAELAKKFGFTREYAAYWLSKWARKRYLTLMPYSGKESGRARNKRGRPKGSEGKYVVGPFWWGELVYDSSLRGA